MVVVAPFWALTVLVSRTAGRVRPVPDRAPYTRLDLDPSGSVRFCGAWRHPFGAGYRLGAGYPFGELVADREHVATGFSRRPEAAWILIDRSDTLRVTSRRSSDFGLHHIVFELRDGSEERSFRGNASAVLAALHGLGWPCQA